MTKNQLILDRDQSCYKCIKRDLCFLQRNFRNIIMTEDGNLLKTNAPQGEDIFTAVFAAVGNACKKFEFNNAPF